MAVETLVANRRLSSLLFALAFTQLAAAKAPEPTRPTLSRGVAGTGVHGLQVGSEGAEWRVPGGPRVRAEAGAVLRLNQTPQPLQLGPGASVAGYALVIRSGKVEVSVPAGAKSAIIVVAPRKSGAIVRSGTFHVAALAGSVALANIEGESTISIQDRPYRPLAAGQVFVATAASQGVRGLVSAPRAVRGQRLWLADAGPARLDGLGWDPVPGAVGYRAELVSEATRQVVAVAEGVQPALGSSIGPQPVGRYHLRVWAKDPSGVVDPRPLDSPLRIIGVDRPPGSSVDSSGAYRLARGQSLRLRGAEGLEMSFGAGRWVDAASRLHMTREERRAVHLRLPGAADAVTLEMALRTLRSRIEILPRNAQWPRDPIEIRVRLEDPSGEPVPQSAVVEPKVVLNTETLAVTFVRRGEWLRGVVEPRRGAGPWVLRVTVQDGQSQTLGYEFSEIVASGPPGAKVAGGPARKRITASR